MNGPAPRTRGLLPPCARFLTSARPTGPRSVSTRAGGVLPAPDGHGNTRDPLRAAPVQANDGGASGAVPQGCCQPAILIDPRSAAWQEPEMLPREPSLEVRK